MRVFRGDYEMKVRHRLVTVGIFYLLFSFIYLF